ncbi:hypothetical protein JYQ77_13675, partial [Anaerobutyricum soehngenii]|uniref:hypothetical protein n=1 Tax=Anaerobutyricum soehngenii TaxID=105843 RepID=UPI001ADD899C
VDVVMTIIMNNMITSMVMKQAVEVIMSILMRLMITTLVMQRTLDVDTPITSPLLNPTPLIDAPAYPTTEINITLVLQTL